jgi:acetolactate synthase I/II/III large subunit
MTMNPAIAPVNISGNVYLARVLRDLGVTHVFYVPVLAPEAMKELTRLGVQPMVTHGEKAAAYMADGYARVSRRVGVCGAQNIGGTNLAAGLRDAYLSRTPVLALTGGPTAATRYRQAYQEFDDLPVFAALTKFNARVDAVERLPDLLATAFRAATSGMPRPVHLQLDGFYAAPLSHEFVTQKTVDRRFGSFPPFRPQAAAQDVDAAIAALKGAERPVIVAGGGVQSSQAGEALRAFAERMQIPVATSLNAKSIITGAHPLALGCAGEYSQAPANRALGEADLVLFVGTPTGGLTTLNWLLPPLHTRVIHLDIEAETIGRNYLNCLPLLGDARVVIEQLLVAAPSMCNRSSWLRTCADFRSSWYSAVEPYETGEQEVMRPERLCRLISDLLPQDAIVVGDTGHAAAWLAQNIAVTSTNQQFIRADGSLGWSLPAAIGAKCAAPEREVICFGGDASFLYHIAELETAVRYRKKIIAIINNNVCMNQEQVFWGDNPAFEQNWRFRDTNFTQVAEGFGCRAIRVDSSDEFVAAFRLALASELPVVIDVRTAADALPQNTWRPPGAPNDHAPDSYCP